MTNRPDLLAVDELRGRMLDAAVAVEIMGWTDLRSQDWEQERMDAVDWPEDIIVTGRNPTLYDATPDRWRPIPSYGSDPAAAFALEERVRELGPEAAATYGRELAVVVLGLTGPWEISAFDVFALAHASPEQRCRAALRTARAERRHEIASPGAANEPELADT